MPVHVSLARTCASDGTTYPIVTKRIARTPQTLARSPVFQHAALLASSIRGRFAQVKPRQTERRVHGCVMDVNGVRCTIVRHERRDTLKNRLCDCPDGGCWPNRCWFEVAQDDLMGGLCDLDQLEQHEVLVRNNRPIRQYPLPVGRIGNTLPDCRGSMAHDCKPRERFMSGGRARCGYLTPDTRDTRRVPSVCARDQNLVRCVQKPASR